MKAWSRILFCFILAAGFSAFAEEPKKDAPKKDPKEMTADEAEAAGLCPVKKEPHKLIYHHEAGGKTYHFCCRKCAKEFGADPSKFGVKADAKADAKK